MMNPLKRRRRRACIHVEVIRLQPSDVIIARTESRTISTADAELIKARLKQYFGDHEVVVMDRLQLQVVRPT